MRADLSAVVKAIPVRIGGVGIRFVDVDLGGVIESVRIGVGQKGVGFVDVDFVAVTQAVPIGVPDQRAGAEQIEFNRVRQPVAVRILVAVIDRVAIAVLVQRIRFQDVQLHAVAERVTICVNPLHVGPVDEHLIPVGQGVPVRVLWLFQFMQGGQFGAT